MPEDQEEFAKDLAAAFDEDALEDTPIETSLPEEEETPKPEEPKPDDAPKDEELEKEEPETPAPGEEEEGTKPPETPETPSEEEPVAEKPLTRQDVEELMRTMRADDARVTTSLKDATTEVMDAYYPEGITNVLVDKATGKELKTPQDVIDATNGEFSPEQAQQWLLNEQYKLDQSIAEIQKNAEAIAETTLRFKEDSVAVLNKYDAVFKKFPGVQAKVWGHYSAQIKADEAKGVILSAPDMQKYYDDFLEPYKLAYDHSVSQAPAPAAQPAAPTPAPAPATPGINDRMDEGGDGGESEVDNPNDFAQQVEKALSEAF